MTTAAWVYLALALVAAITAAWLAAVLAAERQRTAEAAADAQRWCRRFEEVEAQHRQALSLVVVERNAADRFREAAERAEAQVRFGVRARRRLRAKLTEAERRADEAMRRGQDFAAMLTLAGNLGQYGKPRPDAAVIEAPEPDAESRALHAISEHTLAAGVARLREEYRRLGVPTDDAELEAEVQGIMAGIAPVFPQATLDLSHLPRD